MAMIEPTIWSKMHGASTHFPIALVIVTTFCDGLAILTHGGELSRRLRFTGTLLIALGALGGCGAVITGLVMTHGQMMGNDVLLRHHQFVWPAFVMILSLAVWRVVSRAEPSHTQTWVQFCLMVLTSALVSGAGYWGGELLNGL